MSNLPEDEYSFSELDCVRSFRGEQREMTRYIVDTQWDWITRSQDNKLVGFVEWAGMSGERPMAYPTIERSFFKEFLFSKPLNGRIDQDLEQGSNPRHLEREQLVRILSLVAEVFAIWRGGLGFLE